MFRSYFFYLIYGAILTVSLGESEIVNRSTSQVELNVEWEHDYLMLKKIAKSQCDLTLGHCDTSCCGDVDCDEWQKQNFECGDFEKKCNGILSEYDCECGAAIKPEWFSFLCVVYTNPVYLGKFYTTSSTIVSAIDFKSRLKKKGGYLFKYMPENFGSTRKTLPTNQYKFGSQIMTYSLLDESMKLPLVSPLLRRMSLTGNSDACMMGTEKFRISVTASCLTNVVPGKCDEQPLSASFYLVQDNNNTINSTRMSMPVILKTLDFLEGAAVEVVKGCRAMEKKLVKFGRKQLYIFYPGVTKSCPKKGTNSDGVICSDVVVNFQMSYMVNGSDINKVVVNFTVGNIGFLDSRQGALQKNVPVFVKQTFQTKFSDIFSNHSVDDTFSNTERTDSLLNRGYSVGEDLNFKYKSLQSKSSELWKEGFIGVFKNGGSCDDKTPITFGYNYISRCLIWNKKFFSCEQLRNFTELKLDGLINGTNLAPYSNFRNWSEESVPIVRNYLSNQGVTPNSSRCLIQTAQDIYIEYTSAFTESGYPIHRVIGLRVDRFARNTTLRTFWGVLTSRAVFLYVPSSKVPPQTRFWRRMLSPELSENAWLNIFNAFDGDQQEENTFWCITLGIALLAGVAATRLTVDCDFFFL